MSPRDHAETLLRKAAQDEYVLAKMLSDPNAPDEVIGFHAQQAVEKILKAVLALRSVHYRRTHNLTTLIDLLRDNGIVFPAELDDVRRLRPFAIEMRYEEMPATGEEALDREWVADRVSRTRAWVESLL